ncbi:MAG: TonB-dependent receptor [Candidatus Acidiferrum sp.]
MSVAQSPNGTVSGIVLDPSGGLIVGADVLIINNATGVQYPGKANSEGYYVVPNIPPGTYRIQVSNSGFKTIIKPDIVIHVEDALAINFTLPLGAASEIVTVEGGAPLINTESASVSTVIDRQFVGNLPLNGRSFNVLLQLTPGVQVVPTNPTLGENGQFSINGQRTNANYFSVDGVSANFGVVPQAALGQSGAGGSQAFNVFGGTSSLVSVDALQEFRVQTSTFAAEYGRTPGGQVIMTTRSGTNDFHGDVFDYFRNTVLDANDWISNSAGLPRAPEHQNDFGGVVGGPIIHDRTFFFFSYEGLRLDTPGSGSVVVPSATARAEATGVASAVLNSYPVPNGPVSPTDPNLAQFAGNFSNRTTMDATSLRIDHRFNDRFSIFGRYNYSPSFAVVRGAPAMSVKDFIHTNTQTMTVGATMQIAAKAINVLRGNYSKQDAYDSEELDSFGGAMPFDTGVLLPAPFVPSDSTVLVSIRGLTAGQFTSGKNSNNSETQVSIGDDFSISKGTHQLKFGVDYRQLLLRDGRPVILTYYFPNVLTIINGQDLFSQIINANDLNLGFRETSLYAQDTWKAGARLTVNYGLRWELNPAPYGRNGTSLATFNNIDNPQALDLAPAGTAMWNTTYKNFAPRMGVAYQLDSKGDLVLRAGWGIFYDLGTGAAADMTDSYPNENRVQLFNQTLPLSNFSLPPLPPTPPYPNLYLFDRNLELPYSQQWNVALEKALGADQAISVTYVGQVGRRLLNNESSFAPTPLVSEFFEVTRNVGTSDYNALQVSFRRALSHHFQAIANYAWSHSIDEASGDNNGGIPLSISPIQLDRGNSDFDVRHTFSMALTYAIPAASERGFLSGLTKGWAVDGLFVGRTGFPVNVTTATVAGLINPLLLASSTRPDRVPGQPFYLPDPAAPGGRVLNPNAFSIPTTPPRQGDLGRNSVPGFGFCQLDLSARRSFPLNERISLQLRSDFFNLLNHPNFANPDGNLDDGVAFGRSSQTLNQGLGGLSPLYQMGGPRSVQLSLKLIF